MTFIRPVIDLWLFVPDLHEELQRIEARLLKNIMNVNQTASTAETYNMVAYDKPGLRAIGLIEKYYHNGLIPALPEPDKLTLLKSGKTVLPDANCNTLSMKELLSRFYISNKHLLVSKPDSPEFDVAKFLDWRRLVKRQIAEYASKSRN